MSILSNICLSKLKLEDEALLEDGQSLSAGEQVSEPESAEQLTEIEQDQMSLEEDINSLNDAEEAVSTIEEVSEQSKEIMEDSSATDSQIEQQIVVSQEAFAFALGKLGYSKQHLRQLKINTESVSSLREKLKLHNEGVGDFLKKTYENIKKFLKKMWEFVVGLIKKITDWVSGLFIKKPPKDIPETVETEIKSSIKYPDLDKDIANMLSDAWMSGVKVESDNNLSPLGQSIINNLYKITEHIFDIDNNVYSGNLIKDIESYSDLIQNRAKMSADNISNLLSSVLSVFVSPEKSEISTSGIKNVIDVNLAKKYFNVDNDVTHIIALGAVDSQRFRNEADDFFICAALTKKENMDIYGIKYLEASNERSENAIKTVSKAITDYTEFINKTDLKKFVNDLYSSLNNQRSYLLKLTKDTKSMEKKIDELMKTMDKFVMGYKDERQTGSSISGEFLLARDLPKLYMKVVVNSIITKERLLMQLTKKLYDTIISQVDKTDK